MTHTTEPTGASIMLSLALLGPFCITREAETVVDLRTEKERALLAFLAVEADRPHRREALAELLWPERPEGVARTSLRQALTGLRHAIGGEYLLTTRHTVQFDATAPHWLDVAIFGAHVEATQTHAHPDPASCPICMGRRQQAVGLYRDDFLADLVVDDSLAFQEWVTLHRERLFRQQIKSLEQLACYRRSLGDVERARRYARRWVALDPLSERAHRQLMALLALSGQRLAALQQFETCRRILAAELDIEPAPETMALYEQIRGGQAARLVPRRPVSRAYKLPQPLTPFVGRENELAYVTRLLVNPECRLLTVVGPGGVGKTRLALRAAEMLYGQDLLPDGVWFIPLESVSTPDLLPISVARALGLNIEGKREPLAQLLAFLEARTALLVMDNFEHLLGPDPCQGTDLLLAVLRAAPGVKILITSRERLACQAEFLLRLAGLPYPDSRSPNFDLRGEDIRAFGAVDLFFERAGRIRPDLVATEELLASVARICHLVEGLPLGIELAAAGLAVEACADIARQIEANLDALSASLRDLPRRQRSLRAVFEHSWRLLDGAEQALFRRLSVFRGGFGVEAAQAVTDEAGAALNSLEDKSLLRRDAETGRYDLHPLVRQYAAEKLAADAADEADAHGRHARFYFSFLEGQAGRLRGKDPQRALDEIGVELANVRTAWAWAVDQGWDAELEAGLGGLVDYYRLAGLYQEGAAVFQAAVQRLSSRENPASRRLVARLCIERAHLLFQQGRLDEAASTAQTALETAREIADRVSEAGALAVLGNVGFAQGGYQKSKLHLERALSLLEPSEPTREDTSSAQGIKAEILSTLGNCHKHLRDWAAAGTCFDQALACAVEAGDHRAQAMILNNQGILCAMHTGDLGRARDYFQRSLQASPVKDNLALGNLATAHLKLGAYDEAKACYERAIEICREIGARQSELWPLGNLGLLHHYLGDDETAQAYVGQALRLAQEIGDVPAQGVMWLKLGHVQAALGNRDEAAHAYEQSAALLRELGQHLRAGEALAGLARLALARGEAEQAQAHIEGIVDHLEAGGTLDTMISPFQVYLTCYRALEANGDARARGILEVAHSRLQEQAARIADPEQQRDFLKNVAAHRQLLEAFERVTGKVACQEGQ